MERELDGRIVTRGKEFFAAISGEKPSLFNKGAWMGKAMDWSMQNEQFKIQMFRFGYGSSPSSENSFRRADASG